MSYSYCRQERKGTQFRRFSFSCAPNQDLTYFLDKNYEVVDNSANSDASTSSVC